MRKTLAVAVFACFMAFAGTALAASAHFIGTPTATVSGNTLTVTASVAGLGNATGANFSLTGAVTVNSRCYTKSGNKPQAANKQETLNVNQSATFPVRNGRTNVTFTVSPLSMLTCPGGQRVVIESVSYSGLTLSGEGVSYTF
ncbi:MAG TPA: hypothetical protein VF533_21965 [Solirubrobacteraceae bacterium]|jgi:hypothetical protein